MPSLTPTPSLAAPSSLAASSASSSASALRAGRRRRSRSKAPRKPPNPATERAVLGHYVDPAGCLRQVLTLAGAGGSVLVIDRLAATHADPHLVAHLGADEPSGNAALACRDYLLHPTHRWCRRVRPEDFHVLPFNEQDSCELGAIDAGRSGVHRAANAESPAANAAEQAIIERAAEQAITGRAAEQEIIEQPPLEQATAGRPTIAERTIAETAAAGLRDRQGHAYRLLPADTGMSIPALRWHRLAEDEPASMLGLRDVLAALESYEPVRTLTVRALARHRGDSGISIYTLGAELQRLDASRIVLNRGLRDAVLAAIASGELSMSEITVRCGRLKHSARSGAGGDTSWLARRIGLMPEGGRGGLPTPWVHSDVLALIARRGLGISPREVELG